MKIKHTLLVTLFATLSLGALASCGSDEQIVVDDAWSRVTTPTQTSGAIYARVEGSDEDDRLVAASVPADVAAKAELHETVEGTSDHGEDDHGEKGAMGRVDDDTAEHDAADGHGTSGDHSTMTMREVDAIEVPAGETVSLEPGGFHLMLIDLAGPIEMGDTIPVTLTFERAGEVEVDAEAREG